MYCCDARTSSESASSATRTLRAASCLNGSEMRTASSLKIGRELRTQTSTRVAALLRASAASASTKLSASSAVWRPKSSARRWSCACANV
jgi:hypothetical protein